MRKRTHAIFLVMLGIMLFLSVSCSKDNKPTTPNFEEFAPYVWDYKNVLWFDLDYDDAKLGPATVYVSLSSKGHEYVTSLKVNGQPVTFEYMDSYTEGNYFYGATIEVNTTQPVTYEVTYKDPVNEQVVSKYTGDMELPDEISGNFPDYTSTNNYAPSWTYAGSEDPDFQLVNAYASGADQDKYYTRQIDGSDRDYTLLSSFWNGIAPISAFAFDVEAIIYKMRNSNKVLTVGVSNDGYYWSNEGKQRPQDRAKMSEIMEMIHKDMNK